MADTLRYAVLIAPPEQLRALEIAKVLGVLRKVPFHDMVGAARRSWGIVEQNIEEQEARRIAEALSKSGVGAMAVPSALIEAPPSALMVSKIDISEVELEGRAWGRL